MQDTGHMKGAQDVCFPWFSASSFPSLHVFYVLVPSSFHNNAISFLPLFSICICIFFLSFTFQSYSNNSPVLFSMPTVLLCYVLLFQVFVRHLLIYVLPLWVLTLQTTEIDSYRFKPKKQPIWKMLAISQHPWESWKTRVENKQDCREVSYLGLWPKSLSKARVVKTALNAGDCSF